MAANTDWRAGDRLVIASTDLNPFWVDEVTVASVQGRTLTLTAPLKYSHWGTVQSVGGATVDQRAEVGLLSRNIVIEGDPATAPNGLGGHIMVMQGGQARVEGTVEGPVSVTGKLEVGRSARIEGDLTAGTLAIAEGALVRGSLNSATEPHRFTEKREG